MNIHLLQTDLKADGLYTGKIDGIWGPKTEAAWTAWAKATVIEGFTFPYMTDYHMHMSKNPDTETANAIKSMLELAENLTKCPRCNGVGHGWYEMSGLHNIPPSAPTKKILELPCRMCNGHGVINKEA